MRFERGCSGETSSTANRPRVFTLGASDLDEVAVDAAEAMDKEITKRLIVRSYLPNGCSNGLGELRDCVSGAHLCLLTARR